MELNQQLLMRELSFKTSKSSGKGGQHVNKVSSKVLLIWDLLESEAFDPQQKETLQAGLSNRLTKDSKLLLECSQDRSQLRNKKIVLARFFEILDEALLIDKPRRPTHVPKAKILQRLDRKKKHSSKKSDRSWTYKD